LNASTWYFICGTWDGSTLSSYLNGSLNSTPVSVSTVQTIAGSLYIGNNNAGNAYFPGSMAGFRIYNRALSGTEIGTLYTNGINGNIF
jgi:hypothetical protein